MIFNKADGILDLRDRQSYEIGHLKGSTWLSWEILAESFNALPAAPASLFLIGSDDEIEAASILLDSKGYQVSGSLIIHSADELREWTNSFPQLLEIGKQSKTLWKPSPVVAELVESVNSGEIKLVTENNRPAVLDIGCGGGRDAIYLAKQRMNVIAIDNESRVLKRSKALAKMSGANVKFKCCDIKKADCLPEQSFELILMVRFLNRDCFDYIKQRLNSGGLIVVQTFVSGVSEFESPKNPNFILNKGELAEVFADFDIIVDKIDTLADGRPVNSFIAKKI